MAVVWRTFQRSEISRNAESYRPRHGPELIPDPRVTRDGNEAVRVLVMTGRLQTLAAVCMPPFQSRP